MNVEQIKARAREGHVDPEEVVELCEEYERVDMDRARYFKRLSDLKAVLLEALHRAAK